MPVKVPMLQRIAPQDPAPTGRIQTKLPDIAGSVKQTNDSLVSLAGATTDLLVKMEKDTANTQKVRFSNELETWHNLQFNGDGKNPGILHMKGDPTERFNEYDKNFKLKKQELLAETEGYSSRVREAIKGQLANTEARLYNKRLVAWGNKNAQFQQQVTDDAVSLIKSDGLTSVGFLDPKDPTTAAPFDDALNRINQTRVRHALTIGSARYAEDGEFPFKDDDGKIVRVHLNDSVKSQIVKDSSEMILDTSTSLVNLNKTELARFMMKRYGDRLNTKTKGKLARALDDGDLKNEAFNKLASIVNLPAEKQLNEVNKIKDPALREKTLEVLDAHDRRENNVTKRVSTDAYNKLLIDIQKKSDSGNPYDSVFDLQNDPTRKALWDRVSDGKQLQALRETIVRPKGKSDLKAFSRIHEVLRQRGFSGMPFGEFQKLTVGLNKKDASTMTSIWRNRNGADQTLSQQSSDTRFLRSDLYHKAMSAGLLHKVRGQLTRDSMRIEQELYNRVDSNPIRPGSRGPETKEYIDKIILDQTKKEEGDSGWSLDGVFDFFSSKSKNKSSGEPVISPEAKAAVEKPKTSDTLESLDVNQFRALNKQFRDKYDRNPKGEELKKFFEERKKSK